VARQQRLTILVQNVGEASASACEGLLGVAAALGCHVVALLEAKQPQSDLLPQGLSRVYQVAHFSACESSPTRPKGLLILVHRAMHLQVRSLTSGRLALIDAEYVRIAVVHCPTQSTAERIGTANEIVAHLSKLVTKGSAKPIVVMGDMNTVMTCRAPMDRATGARITADECKRNVVRCLARLGLVERAILPQAATAAPSMEQWVQAIRSAMAPATLLRHQTGEAMSRIDQVWMSPSLVADSRVNLLDRMMGGDHRGQLLRLNHQLASQLPLAGDLPPVIKWYSTDERGRPIIGPARP
jgi:exonuclease III